jgi:CelD/BcsL family acetyltransferase involved in cellulose biosynthesis
MEGADSSRRAYTSYVLHVWQATGQHSRRATLQATATGQRYSFASLEALFAFLDAQFVSTSHADAGDGAVVPPEAPRE